MLFHLDLFVTRWINGLAGVYPIVDLVMIGVTHATIPLMVLAVIVRWWSRHEREKERRLAIEAGLTFVLALLINQMILLFVSRVRPYDAGVTHLIIASSTDPSFPSDHAAGAFAIVAAMWLSHRSRRAILFAIPAIILIISRVYVGTHYVSDVVGGVGTALIAAVIVRATAELRIPISEFLIRFF